MAWSTSLRALEAEAPAVEGEGEDGGGGRGDDDDEDDDDDEEDDDDGTDAAGGSSRFRLERGTFAVVSRGEAGEAALRPCGDIAREDARRKGMVNVSERERNSEA